VHDSNTVTSIAGPDRNCTSTVLYFPYGVVNIVLDCDLDCELVVVFYSIYAMSWHVKRKLCVPRERLWMREIRVVVVGLYGTR